MKSNKSPSLDDVTENSVEPWTSHSLAVVRKNVKNIISFSLSWKDAPRGELRKNSSSDDDDDKTSDEVFLSF